MIKSHALYISAAVIMTAAITGCQSSNDSKLTADNVKTVINNRPLTAAFNSQFPGIVYYSLDGKNVILPKAENIVVINGKTYTPEVKGITDSVGKSSYSMEVPEINVSYKVNFVAELNTITLTITDIVESGSELVNTIALPGVVMMGGYGDTEAAIAKFSKGYYSSNKPEDDDFFGKVSEVANGEGATSYIFISDKTSAGLYNNVLDEAKRLTYKKDENCLKVTNGTWIWRAIRSETTETPTAILLVANDINNDGKVSWQDGAIAFRNNTPVPYGAEETKKYPIYHINMNFASQASFPFLRSLDNVKKLYLITDGLGQRVQYKGFAGEGHDSSHPDYAGNVGIRQGGVDELNLVMRRSKDFNTISGVHINATEYHREAKAFQRYANANEAAIGWSWLDESYYTDQKKELVDGTLYKRLTDMRADLPWLSFVYLDVYHGKSWIGWKMYKKTNALGLHQTTEFPGVMERGVIWNHIANDWSQVVWGNGDQSQIARFIFNGMKDTFNHNPVLRGSNSDGFMGWHGERNFKTVVKSAFTVNLPTKYLQHFELLSKTKNKAIFSNNIVSTFDGKVARIYKDGKIINECTYDKANSRPTNNMVLIPWSPNSEDKLYHWNDNGGTSIWELPNSWSKTTTAYLYKLTPTGRQFIGKVELDSKYISLANIDAATPYVLYRQMPKAEQEIVWGEGSLVKEPGFDSYSFKNWTPSIDVSQETNVMNITDDEFGQAHLTMTDKAAVSQTISGLKPGQTYSASVWVEVKENREAKLSVTKYIPTYKKPAIDKEDWIFTTTSTVAGGSGLDKLFDNDSNTLWHTSYGSNQPKYPHEFVIDFANDNYILSSFTITHRDGFGNGTVKEFEALVSNDGKNWTTVAQGEFVHKELKETITFESQKAKYFKLIAKSELRGQDFASAAGLDFGITAPSTEEVIAQINFTEVETSVTQTKFPNYGDTSAKFLRNWHRMKVIFVAPENGTVNLNLIAGEGNGEVKFDNVRLVKTGISAIPAKLASKGEVILFEDFENVDEGWGPFVYGFRGPTCTHLSEINEPYTDDTISGKFSLKTRKEGNKGIIVRTTPSSLKLVKGNNYEVTFDYKSRDSGEIYQLVVGSDNTAPETWQAFDLNDSDWKVKNVSFKFEMTEDDGFIAICKKEKEFKDADGKVKIDNFILDNFSIIKK